MRTCRAVALKHALPARVTQAVLLFPWEVPLLTVPLPGRPGSSYGCAAISGPTDRPTGSYAEMPAHVLLAVQESFNN